MSFAYYLHTGTWLAVKSWSMMHLTLPFQWNKIPDSTVSACFIPLEPPTWSKSRPVLLSFGTTFTSDVVAGYIGYGWNRGTRSEKEKLSMTRRDRYYHKVDYFPLTLDPFGSVVTRLSQSSVRNNPSVFSITRYLIIREFGHGLPLFLCWCAQ